MAARGSSSFVAAAVASLTFDCCVAAAATDSWRNCFAVADCDMKDLRCRDRAPKDRAAADSLPKDRASPCCPVADSSVAAYLTAVAVDNSSVAGRCCAVVRD